MNYFLLYPRIPTISLFNVTQYNSILPHYAVLKSSKLKEKLIRHALLWLQFEIDCIFSFHKNTYNCRPGNTYSHNNNNKHSVLLIKAKANTSLKYKCTKKYARIYILHVVYYCAILIYISSLIM